MGSFDSTDSLTYDRSDWNRKLSYKQLMWGNCLVSVSTMWQCPHCDEQLEDRFHTCWKCGSDPAGNRDPDFNISEGIHESDQTPNAPVDDTQLPSLQLPTVTYFSIPPYIWFLLVITWNDLKQFAANPVPDFSLSIIEIVVHGIAAILIVIPVFIAMFRAIFFCIIRRQNLSNGFAVLFWILSMYRLPASIRQSQRWFVPIYYGSLGALLIAPLAFGAWHLLFA